MPEAGKSQTKTGKGSPPFSDCKEHFMKRVRRLQKTVRIIGRLRVKATEKVVACGACPRNT
ncbi:MAG: hypothetical protein ACRDF4_07400 [Rhabdochlamydiaceae bacterium]